MSGTKSKNSCSGAKKGETYFQENLKGIVLDIRKHITLEVDGVFYPSVSRAFAVLFPDAKVGERETIRRVLRIAGQCDYRGHRWRAVDEPWPAAAPEPAKAVAVG